VTEYFLKDFIGGNASWSGGTVTIVLTADIRSVPDCMKSRQHYKTVLSQTHWPTVRQKICHRRPPKFCRISSCLIRHWLTQQLAIINTRNPFAVWRIWLIKWYKYNRKKWSIAFAFQSFKDHFGLQITALANDVLGKDGHNVLGWNGEARKISAVKISLRDLPNARAKAGGGHFE